MIRVSSSDRSIVVNGDVHGPVNSGTMQAAPLAAGSVQGEHKHSGAPWWVTIVAALLTGAAAVGAAVVTHWE